MISSQAISQLYKKYLGREANPQEIKNLTSGTWNMGRPNQLYDTPEKLSTLLQSTAQSTKNKALQNIDSNIASLKSGQSMFGGKLPDYNTYLNQNPEYTSAVNQQNQALSDYDILSQKEAVAPSKTKDILKAGASLFGESYADLQKKYTDPNSPYYISDPDLQLKVIAQAEDTKYTTMNDIVGKVTDVYKLLTTAAANQLAGNKDKVDLISKSMEKSYDALMSYYGQEMADKTARENQDKADKTQRERDALLFEQQKQMEAIQHQNRLGEIGASGTAKNIDTQVVDLGNGKKALINMQTGNIIKELTADESIGTISFNDYIKQKQDEVGMSFAPSRIAKEKETYDKITNSANDIYNTFGNVVTGLPALRQGESQKVFDNYIKNGNYKAAAQYTLKTALDAADAVTRQQQNGRIELKAQLSDIQSMIKNYNKLTGKTGLVLKATQGGYNLVGETKNPQVAELATRIQSSLQQYRRSITGAQFSQQEAGEYSKIFPAIGKSLTFNLAQIKGLTDQATTGIDSYFKTQMGDSYSLIKSIAGGEDLLSSSRPPLSSFEY